MDKNKELILSVDYTSPPDVKINFNDSNYNSNQNEVVDRIMGIIKPGSIRGNNLRKIKLESKLDENYLGGITYVINGVIKNQVEIYNKLVEIVENSISEMDEAPKRFLEKYGNRPNNPI